MKYKALLEALDKDTIYTPSTIALFAEQNGFLKAETEAERRLEKQRIRISMGRFSNNHGFPDAGDGMVTIKGQAPTPGWSGWRWNDALYM